MGLNWKLPKLGEMTEIKIIIAKSRPQPNPVPFHFEFKLPWRCGPTPLSEALTRRRRVAFWRR